MHSWYCAGAATLCRSTLYRSSSLWDVLCWCTADTVSACATSHCIEIIIIIITIIITCRCVPVVLNSDHHCIAHRWRSSAFLRLGLFGGAYMEIFQATGWSLVTTVFLTNRRFMHFTTVLRGGIQRKPQQRKPPTGTDSHAICSTCAWIHDSCCTYKSAPDVECAATHWIIRSLKVCSTSLEAWCTWKKGNRCWACS